MANRNFTTADDILNSLAAKNNPAPEEDNAGNVDIEDTSDSSIDDGLDNDLVEDDASNTDVSSAGGDTEDDTEDDLDDDTSDDTTDEDDELDEDVTLDWDFEVDDDTPSDDTTVQDNNVILSEVSEALGVEVKDVASIKTVITDLINKTKEEVAQDNPLKGLPTELIEAINIAKSQGDYKAYLQNETVDYTQVDAIDLYEQDVARYYIDANGQFDEVGFNEYLDNVPTHVQKFEGEKIRRALVLDQETKRDAFKKSTKLKEEQRLTEIKSAVESFNKVGNFKLDEKAKVGLRQGLESKALLNKHLFKADGSYDWGKLAKAIFVIENLPKMEKHLAQVARNKEKRELLNELQAPSTNRNAAASSDKKGNVKPLTGLDRMLAEARGEL